MKEKLLREVEAGRLYSSSALRAARHFWTVAEGAKASELADELQEAVDIVVVAVLDASGGPLGVIPRERLFALLSKPFGREILGRTNVGELAQPAPCFDAHAGIFAVAAEALGADSELRIPFLILVDGGGGFKGVLSSRDLAAYLSRMTQDDIELAGRLQERLQDGNEELGGGALSFEAWSRAAKGVGGDFCFTKRLEGGRSFLALCDVSGKGVAASLVVAMVWGMLRMHDYGRDLVHLVGRLNQAVVETFHLEKYLTGFFAVFDPSSGELRVADMGHGHGLLLRAGRVYALRGGKSNLPVGVETEVEVQVERWRLVPGDRLFVFSDGLTEQEDAGGSEFGEARLVAALKRRLGGEGPIGARLAAALDAYRGGIPQQDDMSFMLLSYRGLGHRARDAEGKEGN